LKLPLLLLAPALLHAASTTANDNNSLSKLELKNVRAEPADYHGSSGIKLTEKDPNTGESMAIIKDFTFHNGVIEVDVAGAPSKAAADSARGFIGLCFRMQAGSKFELIYVRPTNARAADQLRRNHTVQYVSAPDWPWERLRKETPGVYESYADMIPGEWTHLRIVVHGTDASLYVGNATQPCLLIHDLKLGDVKGSVALWIGPGTEGYFRDLKISSETTLAHETQVRNRELCEVGKHRREPARVDSEPFCQSRAVLVRGSGRNPSSAD
jgi:hypothetical protein